MRRLVSLILLIVLLISLCACGSKELTENAQSSIDQSIEKDQPIEEEKNDEPINETESNGYFRIVHTSETDAWGDVVAEGPEYIVAIADAHKPTGEYLGVVYLYYNYKEYPYRDYDPHNFYFYIPVPNSIGSEIIYRVDFKIGDEKDYFVCNKYYNDGDGDGYVAEEDMPETYSFLKSQFEKGEDIVFNFNGVHNYIFTIHGEGFSDLIG